MHAVPDTAPGAPGGVAQLDASGKVPAGQLPAGTGGGVQSVNGVTPVLGALVVSGHFLAGSPPHPPCALCTVMSMSPTDGARMPRRTLASRLRLVARGAR
ncbi:MAG TPA: hypothetical protein DEQ61_00280 [Streptomyces sp.]|nr:hypothetical protein [Streptomyces sp.]